MMETDDQLVGRFVKEQKQEIADNGFSDKVLRRISSRNKEIRLSRLWVAFCVVVTVILFITFNGAEILASGVQEIVAILRQSSIPEMDPLRLLLGITILSIIGIKRLFSLN